MAVMYCSIAGTGLWMLVGCGHADGHSRRLMEGARPPERDLNVVYVAVCQVKVCMCLLQYVAL